jgi:hypothetical protein
LPGGFVAGGVVLHEIAGDENGVAHGEIARGIGERSLQRFKGVHTTQGSFGVAKQVRVGELDDSYCAHS